jgi:FkbM family methyltransferase
MTQIHLPPEQAWTFARLPRIMTEHRIRPGIVLHIGAHHGEEVGIYRECGFHNIRLVEPDPHNLAVLHERFGPDDDITIIGAAIATTAGLVRLHRAQRSVWSGLIPHPTATGEHINVIALSMKTVQRGENVLVLDTQGSELELLMHTDLRDLDLVIVETTRRVGDGAAYYDHAVAHMADQHWRVCEEWVHDGSGYSDTVFLPR